MKHAISMLFVVLAVSVAQSHAQTSTRRNAPPIRVQPAALAQLIDRLGGREVNLLGAKVISLLNPQALLIESAGALEPAPGFLNRVVVLVHGGRIRVPRTSLVGATVEVTGVARSVLGMQVSREVAWPPELTDDVVRRYEIRAAILSSTVQTPDGVQLVSLNVDDPPATRDSK